VEESFETSARLADNEFASKISQTARNGIALIPTETAEDLKAARMNLLWSNSSA
jgi:hypothetical protein